MPHTEIRIFALSLSTCSRKNVNSRSWYSIIIREFFLYMLKVYAGKTEGSFRLLVSRMSHLKVINVGKESGQFMVHLEIFRYSISDYGNYKLCRALFVLLVSGKHTCLSFISISSPSLSRAVTPNSQKSSFSQNSTGHLCASSNVIAHSTVFIKMT